MSKKAFSATRTKTAKQDQHYKTEALAEIREMLDGRLYGRLYQQPSWQLTQQEAESLYKGLKMDLSKKSAGARWLATHFIKAGRCGADMPLMADLQKKLAEERRLLRWMRNNEERMLRLGLAEQRTYRYERTERVDVEPYVKYFPQSLTEIGVKTPNDAKSFCDLYEKLYEPDRFWLSGCQVNQRKVALIALTPNYNRLPVFVKKEMLKAPDSAFGKDRNRIGNIWRMVSCAKAWKWASFKKSIAEKVSKLSPKMRILASALTWYEDTPGVFWEKLRHLSRLSLIEQIEWLYADDEWLYGGGGGQYWEKHKWKAFLSESLNIPYGIISFEEKYPSKKDVLDRVFRYGDPKTLCDALFGVSGKATIKAFQASKKYTATLWASAIAYKKPDAIQKILKSESLIDFEVEAVPLLKSIPMSTRIRLLHSKNFKYRGKIEQVTKDHVRDSGYLWSNLSEKPALGRIRDWFGLHEKLAAAFVRELPNEPLPVDEQYGQLDKVCAVDGSWEIEFPRDVATLKYWGEILKNCVGGYGPAIKSGRSVIFGVLEKNTISHCIEVYENTIRQFYSYKNGQPDREIYVAVSELIEIVSKKSIGA